jgi:hypothetical protein
VVRLQPRLSRPRHRRGPAPGRQLVAAQRQGCGHRLVYSYHFAGTEFFSVISVDLAADGDGTRLEFLQTGFPDAQARIEHAKGWPQAIRVMGEALLAMHGIGTLWPKLPEPRHLDGVARDLEAARERLFQENAAK